MTDSRKLHSSIKTYKTANIRKPGPKIITLPIAGGTINSTWEETPDFQKIVGTCFTATSASLAVTITSASVGDKFYITGSDDAKYIYSASLDATASLAVTITSASVGDGFYISGSDGTVYTYSASLDATASLDVTMTAVTESDKFYITGSDNTIYTYSASSTPLPTDTSTIYYFLTGSTLASSLVNLKDEINISGMSSSISASLVSPVLSLYAKAIGTIGNSIGFQSGSIQNLLTGGASKPVDSGNIYYFNFGSGLTLATTVANLKDEINNSDVSASVTGSTITNTLYLWTKNSAVSGSWSFISGSTREWLVGGDIVPADSGNVFYFDIGVGGSLDTASLNLKDEINSSTANTFITASVDTNTLNLYTTVADSIGIATMGFKSGSTQYQILQSDSGSGGTLYIQQAPFTASVDYSGSAIAIADSSGMNFSQNLYSGYVRLKYVQTGSIAPNFLRIYSYLVP